MHFVNMRLDAAVAQLDHGVIQALIVPEHRCWTIVRLDSVRSRAFLHLLAVHERFPEGGQPVDLWLLNGPIPAHLAPQATDGAAAPLLAPVERPAQNAEPADRVEAPTRPKPAASRKYRGGSDHIRETELVESVVPFSRATLWRRVKAGRFPEPAKLSGV